MENASFSEHPILIFKCVTMKSVTSWQHDSGWCIGLQGSGSEPNYKYTGRKKAIHRNPPPLKLSYVLR